MVMWYRLEMSSIAVNLAQMKYVMSSIAVNLAQMKYVLFTAIKHEHCTSPFWHYCDVRSLVYSMTSGKLYTVTLLMDDIENIMNCCKTSRTKFCFT